MVTVQDHIAVLEFAAGNEKCGASQRKLPHFLRFNLKFGLQQIKTDDFTGVVFSMEAEFLFKSLFFKILL